MITPTRFGLTLPQRGVFFGITTVTNMLDMAHEADGMELFDSVWVGDSLLAKPRPDSISLLGALASVTKKVALGVGCMASFPVRDPIMFAYQWGTLDLISQGRMLLAACTGLVAGGASAKEGALWGVADRERAALLEENINICRKLWNSENVTYSGTYTSFEDVTIMPKPVQNPCPIWIASNPSRGRLSESAWERALRRVAIMSDGWMSAQTSPRSFGDNWDKIVELLKEEGRDPANFPNIAYYNININPDREEALDESKKFLDEYYGPVFSPSMVEAWTASGTPKQCIEQLRALANDGAKSITLRITSWKQEEQFKKMVQEVLPYVTS
jgi:alkanesulfonate monooxygenase SsuD/methylene tetrahydromethanopterin reductase-like flavin-dependent oxidoreductase (luciferase family)